MWCISVYQSLSNVCVCGALAFLNRCRMFYRCIWCFSICQVKKFFIPSNENVVVECSTGVCGVSV